MRDREPDRQPANGREEPSARQLHQGDPSVAGLEHPRLQHMLAFLAFFFWPGTTGQQAYKTSAHCSPGCATCYRILIFS